MRSPVESRWTAKRVTSACRASLAKTYDWKISPSLFLPKPNVSLLFHSSYKMRTFWLCKWSSQTCTQYSSNTPTFFLFSLHFPAPSLNPPSSLSHDAFCSKPIHPNGALKTLRGTLDDDSKPGLWKLPDLHSLQRRSWTREELHSFHQQMENKDPIKTENTYFLLCVGYFRIFPLQVSNNADFPKNTGQSAVTQLD